MSIKLTKEQEEQILKWQDKCLEIGRNCNSIDKKVIEENWDKLYKEGGLEKPLYWYCQSPKQAQLILNLFLHTDILKPLFTDDYKQVKKGVKIPFAPDKSPTNIMDNRVDTVLYNLMVNLNEGDKKGTYDTWKKVEARIRKELPDLDLQNEETSYWCQHDINWIGYYKLYTHFKLLPYNDNFHVIDKWFELAKTCGWCYTCDTHVFVCEKPNTLYLNEEGKLHSGGKAYHDKSVKVPKDLQGASLTYSDGFALYYLNGIKVPKELAVTPAGQLDKNFFIKEKNPDVKAQFIIKFGKERLLEFGKVIDSYKNYDDPMWIMSEYTLYDMSPLYTSIPYAPHLWMKNQTVKGLYHLEGVHPDCKNLEEALKFRWRNKHKDIRDIK